MLNFLLPFYYYIEFKAIQLMIQLQRSGYQQLRVQPGVSHVIDTKAPTVLNQFLIWVEKYVIPIDRTFSIYGIPRKTDLKKPASQCEDGFLYVLGCVFYIIPGIPPPIGGIGGAGGLSSLCSTRTHSVVNSMPATEAAFSRAIRVTFVGSITPAL